MSRKREQKDKYAEDEILKNTGPNANETLPAVNFDEYHCTGNVETDFPALCALLNMRDIPAVITWLLASSSSSETKGHMKVNHSQKKAAPWFKPRLQVELENDTKNIKISGWKVNEQILRALQKMLPSVSQLICLKFWRAQLTNQMVISLLNTISLCSSLRAVQLDDNPLPEQSYHILLSEDSPLTELSLRFNRIGDEGARLIGLALSTARSANKNLISLSLAYNVIGDKGAAHIAKGLRLNRTLRFLSLYKNWIEDSGAAHLASILSEFALTHEEVVERRKLHRKRLDLSRKTYFEQSSVDQLASGNSSTSLSINKKEKKPPSKVKEVLKKDDKASPKKESQKSHKKSPEIESPHCKGGKPECKKKQPAQEDQPNGSLNEHAEPEEIVKIVNPLLDPLVYPKDGELMMPGNRTLVYLNLGGNRITEKPLPLFVAALERKCDDGGLEELCLQRNLFPPQCESFMKITELMASRSY